MRISSDGLKAQYQAYVRSRTPGCRKDCPSPKKLIRLLRSESSAKEATEIVDHISRCGSCFCEFEFLVEVLRKEKDFIQEVEQRFPGRKAREDRKGNRRYIFGLRTGWRAAFFLASIILAGALISKLVIFRTPEKYRTGSSARVELVQPVEERIPRSALVFKWRDVGDAEYYILELFDQALSPVWKSEKIAKNHALLPEELAGTLEINRSYFWMVTAHITSGEKIASRLEEFVLKE